MRFRAMIFPLVELRLFLRLNLPDGPLRRDADAGTDEAVEQVNRHNSDDTRHEIFLEVHLTDSFHRAPPPLAPALHGPRLPAALVRWRDESTGETERGDDRP